MISEVVDLLELIRKLVARKSEMDHTYYDNFIKPTWEAFVKIHEDYKVSFKNYVFITNQPNYQVEELVAAIRHDSIYTNDLRSELESYLWSLISSSKKDPSPKEDCLFTFLREISFYFFVKNEFRTNEPKNNDNYDLSYDLSWKDSLQKPSANSPKIKKLISDFTSHDPQSINKDVNLGFEYQILYPANRPRFRAIIHLARNKDENPKDTTEFFNLLIKDLQYRYGKVSLAHQRLKVELLT